MGGSHVPVKSYNSSHPDPQLSRGIQAYSSFLDPIPTSFFLGGGVRPSFLGIQLSGCQLPGASYGLRNCDISVKPAFREYFGYHTTFLRSSTVSVKPSFVGLAFWEFQLSSKNCEFHISGRNFSILVAWYALNISETWCKWKMKIPERFTFYYDGNSRIYKIWKKQTAHMAQVGGEIAVHHCLWTTLSMQRVAKIFLSNSLHCNE